MNPLSKTALASATIAAIVSLSACGGGEGGGSTTPKDTTAPVVDPVFPNRFIPGVPAIVYPASSVFSPVLSSMYTLTTPQACAQFDPYCRLVAGKDAILEIELDAEITTFRLQVTASPSTVLLPSTAAPDCSDVCWKEASLKPLAAMHIPGTNLNRKGKSVFRVRIPAHLNNPSTYWATSFDGTFMSDGVSVVKTYLPKPISRTYYQGESIELVVSPIKLNGVMPANFPNIFQIANGVGVKIPLPVATIRIADTVTIPNLTTLDTIENFNAALRSYTQQVNASASRTYWYGIFSDSVRKGGLAGLGFQPGNSAIGWDSPTQWYRTMTHEVGHNLGLPHTPCGNPGAVDPSYPYPNGDLYAPYPAPFKYPFDLSQGLEQVQENKDVMGYCGGNFFSDYSINKIWTYALPSAVIPLYDASLDAFGSTKVQARSLSATKPYDLETLHKRWDANPPRPVTGPAMLGHVYSWQSGMSNALRVRQMTNLPEKALPGIAVETQHADGLWYSAMAYRTGEERTLDIWTAAYGAPMAIRIPGM